jgi:hypothetical protein
MKKEPRNKMVSISMSQREHEALLGKYEETTYRVFGHFLYALIMRKPLIKKYRNQSLDDIYQSLVDIKSELEKIDRAFNSAIEKLGVSPPGTCSEGVVSSLHREALG